MHKQSAAYGLWSLVVMQQVVLLRMTPDRAETEYGWIPPGTFSRVRPIACVCFEYLPAVGRISAHHTPQSLA